LVDKENIKEEMNVYIVKGLHVPRESWRNCKTVMKRQLYFLRLTWFQRYKLKQRSLLLRELWGKGTH
jgi:hypothetical protein